jgi:uncharacterized membrane protein YdjX (TVP38/TMEM64 family)
MIPEMNEPSSVSADHRLSFAILIVIGVAALFGLGALLGIGDMGRLIGEYWAVLQTMPPLVYFATMAMICILPVPISPFYVAAGPLFGFSTALLWIAPAIAVNQLLAHHLTDGVLRPSLEALLSGRGYLVPKPRSKSEQNLLTGLIRVTPGVPYAIQNWILGLAGVERARYLAISWPIQMLHATAWVLLGQSAFEGRAGVASLAIGLIVAFALVARWVGARLRASRRGTDVGSAVGDTDVSDVPGRLESAREPESRCAHESEG